MILLKLITLYSVFCNDRISGSSNPKTVLYKWKAIPKSYSHVMEYVKSKDQFSKLNTIYLLTSLMSQ